MTGIGTSEEWLTQALKKVLVHSRGDYMKQNLFIMNPMSEKGAEKIGKRTPNLYATPNGEEVLAMIKNREVDRVCIVWGALNFSEYEMSAAIHKIDPSIPVLIMSSYLPEIPSPNEYITTDSGFFFECVNEFLNGEFAEKDYKLFPKLRNY